mmetsp:Transcript_33246/g.30191  ORF Transcript_33246/g.30191 Transcript_33246/m.30191 type:complete len:240 (+) Transcript_33246:160-879(+)
MLCDLQECRCLLFSTSKSKDANNTNSNSNHQDSQDRSMCNPSEQDQGPTNQQGQNDRDDKSKNANNAANNLNDAHQLDKRAKQAIDTDTHSQYTAPSDKLSGSFVLRNLSIEQSIESEVLLIDPVDSAISLHDLSNELAASTAAANIHAAAVNTTAAAVKACSFIRHFLFDGVSDKGVLLLLGTDGCLDARDISEGDSDISDGSVGLVMLDIDDVSLSVKIHAAQAIDLLLHVGAELVN